MNSATKLMWILALLVSAACDVPGPGTKTQAIIECNGSSIGLTCDTDDDPCTQEVCAQQGASVACALAQLAPDGTPCVSDGLPCTADTCQAGSCDHVALAADTLCDDGLFCTAGETCNVAGICGDASDQCEDGNTCTVDSCDEVANQCDTLIAVGAGCDDGDACTTNTTCSAAAACTDGDAVNCEDGSECTSTDCDPATGCTFAPLANSPCGDAFFCTIGESCTIDGECEGTANCSDDNACTADSCDELGASCSNLLTPGLGCNDGNDCTSSDSCSVDGVCTGSPVANGTACGSAGGCVSGGTCSNGTCVGGTAAPDNTPCDDDNACTNTDVCTLGLCAGYPLNCHDSDPCTADGCDEVAGCFHLPIEGCSSDPDAGVPDAGIAPDAGPDAGRSDLDASPDAGAQGVLGGGGCQSSGRGSGGLAALLLIGALFALRRRRAALVACAIACIVPTSARADGFDSELYKPATSSTSFLSQGDADVLATWRLNLGVSFNVSSDPLVLRDASTGEPLMDGVVVSRRSSANLSAGIGLPGPLELGLAVPLIVAQSGNSSLLEGAREIDTTSVGDLRAEIKARLWRKSALRVGAALSASLPVGDDSALFAESSATVNPRLLLAIHTGPLRLGADLGLRMRKQTEVAGLIIDDEWTAGLGASYALSENRVWLVGETYARRAVTESRAESTPAEALLGARYRISGPYQVLLAGGVGIGGGYGTPAFRGLFAMNYVPPNKPALLEEVEPEPVIAVEAEPPPPPVDVDSDADGIFDPEDACPSEAEDKDDFEDEDGCPDLDNDGDAIADVDDACPLEAEVVNGINDSDGCPDEGIIVMIEDRVVLGETVLFDKNRSRVKREGRMSLQAIITLFEQHPEWLEMRVEGHADSRGAAEFNLELSQRRALRVRDEMINLGMDPKKISYKGFGETVPLVTTGTEEAMQKNRRVEFVVVNAHKEVQERTITPASDPSAPFSTPARATPPPAPATE